MSLTADLLGPGPDFAMWLAEYGVPACVNADPDVFFPERGEPNAGAKDVCARCPCLEPCAEYALAHANLDGMWGGMSEQDRREERHRRGWRTEIDAPRCVHPKCRRVARESEWCAVHAHLADAA